MPPLDIIRTVPGHPAFLARLASTVTEIRSPLGFLRWLTGAVDVKRSGLLPIENLARYYALSNAITTSATTDVLPRRTATSVTLWQGGQAATMETMWPTAGVAS